MGSMVDYMLDEKAVSEGITIHLRDQAGKLSGDSLKVRSMHSSEFQTVMEEIKERARKDPDIDIDALRIDAQVALVASWTFEEECNLENVRKFLLGAPHILAEIDIKAGNHGLFFTKAAKSSLNGQSKKSHLPKGQKVAKEQRPSI